MSVLSLCSSRAAAEAARMAGQDADTLLTALACFLKEEFEGCFPGQSYFKKKFDVGDAARARELSVEQFGKAFCNGPSDKAMASMQEFRYVCAALASGMTG